MTAVWAGPPFPPPDPHDYDRRTSPMTAWHGKPSPAEALQQWHAEARERDEAALAAGPDDDTESDDPFHPWRGSDD